MQFQPVGENPKQDLIFPSSPADFELLRSLGPNRQIWKISQMSFEAKKPWRCNGYKLTWQDGRNTFLGREHSGASLTMTMSSTPARIEIEKTATDGDRTNRRYQAYKSDGSTLDYTCLYNPLFRDNAFRSINIPADHDIVGISLTQDSEGFIVWLNFITLPKST
jgi:hypothetical protein